MAYSGAMASKHELTGATSLELSAWRKEAKARRAVAQDQLGMVLAEMLRREMKEMATGARYLDFVSSPKTDNPTYWELECVRDEQGHELLPPWSEEMKGIREFFNSHYADDYNDCFGGPGGGGFDLDEGHVVAEAVCKVAGL